MPAEIERLIDRLEDGINNCDVFPDFDRLRECVRGLVAERDALLRHCVRRTYEGDGWYAQDGGRYALTNHGWGFYRTEAEAIEAVRKAAGLDRGEV